LVVSVTLVEPTIRDRSIPEQPPLTASADDLLRGEQLYNLVCSGCHGGNARSGGIIPDLRLMASEKHDIFKEIVIDGILSGVGMASFSDVVTEEDAERIRQFVISRALIDKAEAEAEAASQTETAASG
jgi:mono/diheme cytochrome c family protein